MNEFIEKVITTQNEQIERWLVQHAEHYPGPHEYIYPASIYYGRVFKCSCKASMRCYVVNDGLTFTVKMDVDNGPRN